MDWFKQANELTDEWLKAQKNMFDAYSNSFADTAAKEAISSSFADNPMMSLFTGASQKLAQQYAQVMSPVKQKTAQDYIDDSQKAITSTIAEMWSSNEEFWKKISNNSSVSPEATIDNEQYFDVFKKSMDPEVWTKHAFGNLDFLNKKFSDKPAFAGTTNFDKKLQSISDNWSLLQEKLTEYSGVVMEAWIGAYERFRKDAEDKMTAESWPASWKDVSDNWMEIANQALLEMQKSEDYLQAQKEVLNANSEYRLSERTVAEELCELYHIPTRTEVDELHQKVYLMNKELRELRKLKQKVAKPKSSKKPVKAKVAE